MRRASRSRAPALLALWLVVGAPAAVPLGAQPAPAPDVEQDADAEAGPVAGAQEDARTPHYLRGIDLDQPAQAAFAGWPPPSLGEQAYWLPWSWPAFRRAALFGRPVLLVMAPGWASSAQRLHAGALSDPEVWREINRSFIAVRVNPDLRPDVSERYATGVWPVVAFLLPDGTPMLSQANDLGVARPITAGAVDAETLLFLTEQSRIYWNRNAELLRRVGRQWMSREGPPEPLDGEVTLEASDLMAQHLEGNADRRDGGFGLAPKFLPEGLASYGALRAARGDADLAEHARLTLVRLVASPLYDQVEGGMHRLAAAPGWEGIQYEKMLEGNARLMRQLVTALRRGESETLTGALRGTATFLLDVLQRPDGGFWLAQRADPGSPDGGGYWRRQPRDPAAAPPVDRLLLTGPNALAGAALLRAGTWLDDEQLRDAGRRALELVERRAVMPGRGVKHAIDPPEETRMFLTAQASAALGLFDAYETTGNTRWLELSRELVEAAWRNLRRTGKTLLDDRLEQPLQIGLLEKDRQPLEPNVKIARTLIRLAAAGGDERDTGRARGILATHAGDLSVFGVHGTTAALAIEELLTDPLVVRIDGDPADARTAALRRAALRLPQAWSLVLTGEAGATPRAELSRGDVRREVTRPESLAAAAAELQPAPGGEASP